MKHRFLYWQRFRPSETVPKPPVRPPDRPKVSLPLYRATDSDLFRPDPPPIQAVIHHGTTHHSGGIPGRSEAVSVHSRRGRILHQSASTARFDRPTARFRPNRTFADSETDASYEPHACLQAVMSLLIVTICSPRVEIRSHDAL